MQEKFISLHVWKRMHSLVLEIYCVTKTYPTSEKFGLISQMRRAAVSVAANIAEGSRRRTIKDRNHFHVQSDASLQELKYFLILSKDLGLLSEKKFSELLERSREVGKMLNGLMKSLLRADS